MGYPAFLCIGARKAGTTWLHVNLSQHPQIWLPPVKEMHYFDHRPPWLIERLFGRASHLRGARKNLREAVLALREGGNLDKLRWAARYCFWPRSDEWYRSLFPSGGSRLAGEVCPGYARIEGERIATIARNMGKVKIVYLLRDPVECAWSSASAHFSKKKGGLGIQGNSIEDIESYLGKVNSVSHLSYARNLATWRQHFPDEQIFVGFYDDLKSDPRGMYKRVLTFLGIDDSDACIPSEIDRKRGTVEGRRGSIPEHFDRFLARLHLDTLVQLDSALANEHTASWLANARSTLSAVEKGV